MNKFALIGHPLGHSMSPLIHEKLFALSGLEDTSYELIDIAPEAVSGSRGLLETLRGLNVTIPHKQAVIALVDELAESAQRYNSVNCISLFKVLAVLGKRKVYAADARAHKHAHSVRIHIRKIGACVLKSFV